MRLMCCLFVILQYFHVNVYRKILDGKPLEVEVKGLQCMNDNPTKVRVLYAKAFSEKFVLSTLKYFKEGLSPFVFRILLLEVGTQLAIFCVH